MIPFFDNTASKNCIFFSKFLVKNVLKFEFCPENRTNLFNSLRSTPFGLLTQLILLGEKSLTKRHLISSCCPSIPSHFPIWVPPLDLLLSDHVLRYNGLTKGCFFLGYGEIPSPIPQIWIYESKSMERTLYLYENKFIQNYVIEKPKITHGRPKCV